MTLLTSEHPIPETKRKIPLCLVLVVPFVLQIFAAVGLIGWLSLRNGQKDVHDIASQLRNEVTARILQRVTTYLETPQLVTQINADAVRLGELNLQDSGSLERHFWHQMQLFKSLRPIAFGNEQGEIRSVDRLDDGTLVIRVVDKSTGGKYHTYATNNQGNRAKLIEVKETFDPRTRPWYKAAVKIGKLTWTEIYPYFSSDSLAISAARPFYDNKTGTLLGVTNATLSLSQIGDFLNELKIGRSGQTFIVERSGDLVACSRLQKPFTISKEGGEEKRSRLQAIHSSNRLTRLTTQYLIEHFGDLSRINGSQQLDFKIDGKRQFLQVTPFANAHGLDWLIVVVVPEDDFMKRINANTHTTIVLCLLALVLATLMGILTARRISRSILRLSKASRALAKRAAVADFASGQLDQKIEPEGIDELELLVQSFNLMAKQLQESFAALEKTNDALSLSEKRFRLAVDQFPNTFVIYDANRRFQFVNAHGVRVGGLSESALLGHTDEEKHPPEITDAYLPHLLKAVETRTSQTAECTINLPTIGKITFVVTYVPLLDERGEIYQILGSTHDITQRKIAEMQIQESLQEKEVLLQEIHHRVKNNLQVISSLLDLQSQHIEEQATLELFRQSCSRIKAMALVHETLYKFNDFAKINFTEYIENLTGYLFSIYGVDVETINLELYLDEVAFKIDTAIPCGLIINELVSNALKHAFLNQAKGTIYITLHFDEDNSYTLIVRDNGIGLPPNWESKTVNSLGLKLVEILANQLEGTLQVNSRCGTEFSLKFRELS